jgi:hypothetical protein
MKIYFDESGNTGQNLLDNDQPIYILASNNFTDIEAQNLLKSISSNGKELHFKEIRKYYKYQQQLIEVLNNKLINSENIKYSYANKKFVLVCHIVDQLIEPVFYNSGIDIYKKGLNITFSNAIYTFGVNIWDKELFNKFLRKFQLLMRESSSKSIENFYKSAIELSASVSGHEKLLIEPIIFSKKQIKEILSNLSKYSIDLSLPSFAILSDWWGKQIRRNFDVIHDDSKQIDFWKEYISFISSITKIKPMEVGYDYRKMNYPLAINSLLLEDSKLSKQIQISDLIASSLSFCIKKRHIDKDFSNDFANAIFSSRLTNIIAHPMMPSTKLTPEDLGTEDDKGVNPLDYLAGIATNHKEEFDLIMEKIIKK